MRDATGAVQSVALFGATSGIGAATVRALAAAGRLERAILAARSINHPLAGELRATGVAVEEVAFDASDTGSAASVVDRVFAGGDIDVVIFAWGVLGDQAEAERSPSEAVAVAEVNYVAVVAFGLHVADRFREQGHGSLVVISSVAAERARRANFVYGSSKAGADAFAQGLNDSLRGSGARVMVVRPGFVHTRMTEGLAAAPFATTPDVVAEVIVKGLRTGAHTVWAPPVLRAVMTVLRHLPRWLFRLLPG